MNLYREFQHYLILTITQIINIVEICFISGFLLLFLPHKALLMAHGKRSPGKVSPARI